MANEEEQLKGPTFYPPVYQQRYDAVKKLVKEFGCKTLVDMGCSEGKLLTAVRIHCLNLEAIIGIDVDKEILLQNRFRTMPLMAEYLKKREAPLKMALYQGSVASPDVKFANFDVFTCVEVIEHLQPDSLEAFPASVFGVLSPKCAIITTPNADFNILFPNMVGFRHPDHKFEWSRKEFKDWCTFCSHSYNYSVEISFIGFGPDGTEQLGGCTQVAVFKKLPSRHFNGKLLESVNYETYDLVTETIFPYEPPKSLEERLEEEVKYTINRFSSMDFEMSCNEKSFTIPLSLITEARRIQAICKDSDLIRDTVAKFFELSEDKLRIVLPEEEDSGNDLENGACNTEEGGEEWNEESSCEEFQERHLFTVQHKNNAEETTALKESEEFWD